jgi:hypothetical protein
LIFVPIGWGVCRSVKHHSGIADSDRLLFIGWLILFVAYYGIAGAGALTPGHERYGMVLIAPTVAAICRGWDTLLARPALRAVGAVITFGIAFSLLGMFHSGFFKYVERTGDTSASTFLTGSIEPKAAAWKIIKSEDTAPSHVGFVRTSTWWNAEPLRYFAAGDPNNRLVVVQNNQLTTPESIQEVSSAAGLGRLWVVEFAGSPELTRLTEQLTQSHAKFTQQYINGYSGNPVDVVVHIEASNAAP